MLIDVWREIGLEGIAQVDLEAHRNRHQPLSALTPMALTVLATIARRLEREGRLTAPERAGAADGGGEAMLSLADSRAPPRVEPLPLEPVERPALVSVSVA